MLQIDENFRLNEWRGNTRIVGAKVTDIMGDSAIVTLYKPSGWSNCGPVQCGAIELPVTLSHRKARKALVHKVYSVIWYD